MKGETEDIRTHEVYFIQNATTLSERWHFCHSEDQLGLIWTTNIYIYIYGPIRWIWFRITIGNTATEDSTVLVSVPFCNRWLAEIVRLITNGMKLDFPILEMPLMFFVCNLLQMSNRRWNNLNLSTRRLSVGTRASLTVRRGLFWNSTKSF